MNSVSAYSKHGFAIDGDNDSFSNLFGFVPRGSRVLDVGCATGNFAQALQDLKGCSVVGIDIHEKDIAEARMKIRDALVLDVTSDGALAELGTFDVIVFADVLEHLTDPRSVLRAIRAVLNPQGRLLFSIPNMSHLSVRLDLLNGLFPYTETGLLDKTHIHFYDRPEVEALFGDSGFRISDEKPVVVIYPPELIDQRLRELKLEPSPEFHSMLEATEADVFQFVGVAVPEKEKALNEINVRVRVSPLNEIKSYAADAIERASTTQKQLESVRASLEASRSEATVLRRAIDDMRRSRSWRATRLLREASGALRRVRSRLLRLRSFGNL